MEIFKILEEGNYEELLFCQDAESGLKAIICIHNTILGPSLGGIRYWEYKDEESAIIDAVRLAKGMTYKNALAGLELGGAKTVMLKDPKRPKDEAQMKAFGRFVEGLNGRYITAEDVGTTEQDMDWIYSETDYVLGTTMKSGASGNPAPITAQGVYCGIKAAVKKVFGSENLSEKIIVVQGAGNVGYSIIEKVIKDGAKVYVYDFNRDALNRAVKLGAIEISEDEVYTMNADIFVPCALGGIINDSTVSKLKVKIVAGSANNQLEKPEHGDMLNKNGILYVPDYLINAGGAINVADEFYGGYNYDRAMLKVENIYNQIEKVFEISERDNIPTYVAADRLAEERINSIRNTRKIFVNNSKNLLKRM